MPEVAASCECPVCTRLAELEPGSPGFVTQKPQREKSEHVSGRTPTGVPGDPSEGLRFLPVGQTEPVQPDAGPAGNEIPLLEALAWLSGNSINSR
jgi:hypothetical protein